MELSTLVNKIAPSKIRKMFNLALQYNNVISFALGEPDFTASENIVEAGVKALKTGKTRYTPNAGIIELREAIAQNINNESSEKYNSEEIIITVGAMEAIYLALKVLLNPNDEVILSAPCWTNYSEQVKLCGGIPVLVEAKEESGFMIDIQKVESAITQTTKVILINSPCNPTGGMLDYNNLEKLANLAKKHDLFIISDEVYRKILLTEDAKHVSITSLEGMKERSIFIDSFSKTYAMTGWRVGYAVGPEDIIKNMVKFQEDIAGCVATPCQYAALEALTGSSVHVEEMVSEYRKRGEYLYNRINSIPGLSCKQLKATFYAFINIKETYLTSDDFALSLLKEKQVVVIPGTAFSDYGEGYIRLSFATSLDNIEEGINRIEQFVTERECKSFCVNGSST